MDTLPDAICTNSPGKAMYGFTCRHWDAIMQRSETDDDMKKVRELYPINSKSRDDFMCYTKDCLNGVTDVYVWRDTRKDDQMYRKCRKCMDLELRHNFREILHHPDQAEFLKELQEHVYCLYKGDHVAFVEPHGILTAKIDESTEDYADWAADIAFFHHTRGEDELDKCQCRLVDDDGTFLRYCHKQAFTNTAYCKGCGSNVGVLSQVNEDSPPTWLIKAATEVLSYGILPKNPIIHPQETTEKAEEKDSSPVGTCEECGDDIGEWRDDHYDKQKLCHPCMKFNVNKLESKIKDLMRSDSAERREFEEIRNAEEDSDIKFKGRLLTPLSMYKEILTKVKNSDDDYSTEYFYWRKDFPEPGKCHCRLLNEKDEVIEGDDGFCGNVAGPEGYCGECKPHAEEEGVWPVPDCDVYDP